MRRTWIGSILMASFLKLVACGTDIQTNSNAEIGRPQLAAIDATPFTIMPDDTSIITIRVLGADINTLTISYEATGGIIEGAGTQVLFIAGSTEGVAWITVTVDDGRGNISSGSATIRIVQDQPIMSVGVQVLDASSAEGQCLVFSALPAETLFFLRVVIENPVGQTFEVSGSATIPVPANQPFPLQFEGQCYTLHKGTYNLTFTLQRATDANSFAFNTTHVQP